jgi:hypothetical protein
MNVVRNGVLSVPLNVLRNVSLNVPIHVVIPDEVGNSIGFQCPRIFQGPFNGLLCPYLLIHSSCGCVQGLPNSPAVRGITRGRCDSAEWHGGICSPPNEWVDNGSLGQERSRRGRRVKLSCAN